MARGAAAIGAIAAKKYPYSTAYRLIRQCLEKNVHKRGDSDAFSVGANLTIAFWLAGLPNDLSWREKTLARHRDLVGWLLPRVGLPLDEVVHAVARAAGLTPALEQQLVEFVRREIR